MEEQKIIECPDCESKVSAKVIAKKEYGPTDDYDPFGIFFLECPVCKRTMIGHSDLVQTDYDEWGFESPTRLWPNQEKYLDINIPRIVRKSIDEASKCYKAKAYAACAVMCGRSLEALCKEHKTKNWQLAKGLKELKDNGIIDGRIFEWSEALRDRRNIGAHANEEEISKEDARDVLDFTFAICEYVYVLADKYNKFKEREQKKKALKSTAITKPLDLP
jgi:hypothetical protein